MARPGKDSSSSLIVFSDRFDEIPGSSEALHCVGYLQAFGYLKNGEIPTYAEIENK